MIKRKRWMIYDWTGQCLEAHGSFISFDSAEDYLSQWLDEAYDTDRQEYYIVPVVVAKLQSLNPDALVTL